LPAGLAGVIGSDNAPAADTEFKVSVFPGNAGVSGIGNVGTNAVPVNESLGTNIWDYAFYKDGGSTTSAVTYASGVEEMIGPLNSLVFSSGYFGNTSAGQLWETTDPGINYSTAPDFDDDVGLGAVSNVAGVIDISALSTGSVYFVYGAYRSTTKINISMTDTNGVYPTLELIEVGDNDNANNHEYYIYRCDFDSPKGYDTITYAMSNTTDNARLHGVILTGTHKPPKGIVIELK
jgi:hypothetical protein